MQRRTDYGVAIPVLIKISITAMKHLDQSNLLRKGFYLAYTSIALFIIKESQIRNSNRERISRNVLIQRPQRNVAY